MDIEEVVAFAVSALILYACSTLYHGAYLSRFQPFLETIDSLGPAPSPAGGPIET